MRKLFGYIDTTSQGWLTVLLGQVGRLFLGFVPSVLIARALGPDDFGLYGILAATAAFVNVLADSGLSSTMAQRLAEVWPGAVAVAQQRTRVFFWLRLGLVGLIVLPLLALAGPLSQILLGSRANEAILWWQLTLLGVAATALSGSLSAILRGSHYFGRITIISLTNTALTAVLAIILQLNGRLTLSNALLILGIVPSLVSFAVAYRLLPPTLDLRLPTKADWQTELRPLWRFSRWLGLSNILVILTTQMDLILLQRWVVEASLGHYFLALNLVTKLDIVNQSLYTVLVPSAAKLSTAAEFQAYLRRSLKRGLLITALLAPLLIVIRPLIELFYGVEFGPAAALFRWLFGLFFFDVLTLPVILLIFPLQQPKLLAVADASRALIFLGTAVLLMPSYGALGVIIAKGAAKLLSFLLLLLLLRARHVWPIPARKNAPHI